MTNQQIGHELVRLEDKEGISLLGSFKMGRLLTKRVIGMEFIKMFKENPGLTEAEYLKRAMDIYYELGGQLVPDGEEE